MTTASAPTAARRELFTRMLLRAQAQQAYAGLQIQLWLEALAALEPEAEGIPE